jgi:hypothetical protein
MKVNILESRAQHVRAALRAAALGLQPQLLKVAHDHALEHVSSRRAVGEAGPLRKRDVVPPQQNRHVRVSQVRECADSGGEDEPGDLGRVAHFAHSCTGTSRTTSGNAHAPHPPRTATAHPL